MTSKYKRDNKCDGKRNDKCDKYYNSNKLDGKCDGKCDQINATINQPIIAMTNVTTDKKKSQQA